MPVIFSRACEYALRGLAEMARHPEKKYWTVQELSAQTDTPAPFLAKTFQTLVKNGILTSTKGRHGGFSFARPIDEIILLEIVRIIDGPALEQDCVLGFSECGDADPCPFHEHWRSIRQSIVDALSTESLDQFAQS